MVDPLSFIFHYVMTRLNLLSAIHKRMASIVAFTGSAYTNIPLNRWQCITHPGGAFVCWPRLVCAADRDPLSTDFINGKVIAAKREIMNISLGILPLNRWQCITSSVLGMLEVETALISAQNTQDVSVWTPQHS